MSHRKKGTAMRKVIAVLLCLLSLSAAAQKPKATDVRFEIQPDPTGKVLVNWSITNNSKLAVYVYDFFLWGPGQWNEQSENRTVLGTAPSREEPTCPPNRVAPVLLLVVAPGRTIHGDFIDSRLELVPKTNVSMRIAIFSDPYTVVEKAKSFADSGCKHSPYDALVQEGTIVESNAVQLP
jgi:hypothetical protein